MNQILSSKYYLILIILFTLSSLDAQQNNREFRATWVITWEHISSGSSVEENKARVREILDNHVRANMTSVIFQARQSGTAYYESSYEPWGSYAGSSHPGYDPLQYAVEEAHNRGLELHAWFNAFSVSSTQEGTIANLHPEWICRDQDGNPMTAYRAASPGLSAVREYTINVAMEIVRDYDIDGLHLDYVRWNEYDTDDMIAPPSPGEQISKLDGYVSKEKIQKIKDIESTNRFIYDVQHPYSGGVPSGFASWEDWRRWSVTEFVKTLHDSIQAVKPWVRLSPAALGKYKEGGIGGWNGYYVVFQDAALWFNEGYVDQLTPMHYHWLNGNDLYSAISSDWEPNIQTGISEGRMFSVGPASYLLADNNIWGNHVGIVNTLRPKSWVDGFQFFSYGSWRGYNYWDEAAELFFKSKVKVRSINSSIQSLPPSLVLNEVDSLNYEITITPDAAENQNQWYAIYRSEDVNLDVNTDQIISIHFGNSSYTFEERFSGIQNYNGSYTYFATALNRYWSESEISNSATTNLIPSFPPQVVSTYPVANDTIAVDEDIVIEFSKSMKVTSFYNYLSFEPEVQITSLLWSNDNKQLRIGTENLSFDTEYTFTISSDAVDYNDVNLDGNGDGIAGDLFSYIFRTNNVDLFSPQVVNVYPNDNDHFIDIASTFTIEFDELVDEQTIADNGIQLLSHSGSLDFEYIHTETPDERSIISIQPTELLTFYADYNLVLGPNISDIAGNSIGAEISFNYSTSQFMYDETKSIDDFTNPGDWWAPSGSGSTTGIFESGTSFDYSDKIVLPVPTIKRAGKLSYLWDENANSFLIREYLSGGTPQTIYFDSNYFLQTYLFGDGSNNQFRFCIDEFDGSAWGDHEVSKWITIDWHGWKLVEWDLSDPNSVGTWISANETLTGSYFRVDSYQLTKSDSGAISGAVYFDDLRAVKKDFIFVDVENDGGEIKNEFILSQNYPNPFNPSTTIKYSIPSSSVISNGERNLKASSPSGIRNDNMNVSIKVYDILGREVATLLNEQKSPGSYRVTFDGSNFSSGTYFYKLQYGSFVEMKKMILLK